MLLALRNSPNSTLTIFANKKKKSRVKLELLYPAISSTKQNDLILATKF